MQYSEIIYLKNSVGGFDEIGNAIETNTSYTKCYAKKQSIKTNEFYNAVEVGLTPSMEFVIKRLNYNGEDEIKWNDTLYKVIRTIDPKNKFDIVLVCAKKIGINNEGISA